MKKFPCTYLSFRRRPGGLDNQIKFELLGKIRPANLAQISDIYLCSDPDPPCITFLSLTPATTSDQILIPFA